MKKKIEHDAIEIVKQVKEYASNPLNEKKEIKLNSFDFVIPFNNDPAIGSDVHKQLYGSKGVYVFIMTDDYIVPSSFDDVYKGLQEEIIKTNFKKVKFYTLERPILF